MNRRHFVLATSALAGASLIGLPHAAESRRSDFPSVKDFGAKGNGATNDLMALQAAVDSGASYLLFPAGIYMVGARIKPASGQAWIGVPGQTIIKLSAGAASTAHVVMRNQGGMEGSLDDFSATGIIFDGNGKDTGFLQRHPLHRLRIPECRHLRRWVPGQPRFRH